MLGGGFPVASQFNVKLEPSDAIKWLVYLLMALQIAEYSSERDQKSKKRGISQLEAHMGKSLHSIFLIKMIIKMRI